jgi:uncharacterized membrane protein
MATAVVATVVFQIVTPSRGRLAGWWVFPIIEVLMLGILIVRDPGRIDRRSAALRRDTIVLIAIMTIGTLGSAILLCYQIVTSTNGISADAILGRGASVWLENVIVFSLWYWELDRGGAAERAARSGVSPSLAFPEDTLPDLAPPGWIPTYPDYLYLAFTNATAFSPTDTMPVRTWAKMTMMLQSGVSLSIAILVVARAINLLPG